MGMGMEGSLLLRAPSLVQSRPSHAGQVLQAPAVGELRTFRPSLAGRHALVWSREGLATNARVNGGGSPRSRPGATSRAVADQCPWAKKRKSALRHIRRIWERSPSLVPPEKL